MMIARVVNDGADGNCANDDGCGLWWTIMIVTAMVARVVRIQHDCMVVGDDGKDEYYSFL